MHTSHQDLTALASPAQQLYWVAPLPVQETIYMRQYTRLPCTVVLRQTCCEHMNMHEHASAVYRDVLRMPPGRSAHRHPRTCPREHVHPACPHAQGSMLAEVGSQPPCPCLQQHFSLSWFCTCEGCRGRPDTLNKDTPATTCPQFRASCQHHTIFKLRPVVAGALAWQLAAARLFSPTSTAT